MSGRGSCSLMLVAVVVVVVLAVAGCLGRLVAPRLSHNQRQPVRQLPEDWAEMAVAHLEEDEGLDEAARLELEQQLQQLLAAAHRAALPVGFTRMRRWQNAFAADLWLQVLLPRDSGAGSAGRVLVVSAASAVAAARFLLPPERQATTRGYLRPGVLLLLLLARDDLRQGEHQLAESLLRHRAALRLLVATPTRVLRLEPFARRSRGGWGVLREVSGPWSFAHAPQPKVLGRMAGYPLLLVHEPRDIRNLVDDKGAPDWRRHWSGHVFGLISQQLGCNFRLSRTKIDIHDLGFFDISYGLRSMLNDKQYGRVQPPVVTTRIVVLAPPRDELPLWMQMVSVFSREMWCCVLGAYLIASIVWYGIGRAQGPRRGPSLRRSLSDMLVALLSMEWPRELEERAAAGAAARLHLAGVALLSLVLVTLYQSAVVDVVRKPHLTPAIRTLDDLDRSGLLVYHRLPYFVAHVFDDADSIRMNLAKKFIEEPPGSTRHGIMSVAQGGFAVIMNDFALNIISLGMETRLRIQVIEEPLRTIYTSFVVPLRSPFADAINIANLRLTQFGILPDPKIYFKTVLKHTPHVYSHLHKQVFQDTTARSFNINDLKTCLYVLAFCLSLASLVLILELLSVTHFWQKMTRRIRFLMWTTLAPVHRFHTEF